MKTAYKLLILFAALLQFSFVAAQGVKSTAKISGLILDDKHQPLPFATVALLKAADSSLVKGAITNDAGTYSFEHLNQGKYVVRVTTMGFLKAKSNVLNLSQTDIQVPAIQLSTGAKALKAVNVTSTPPLIEHKTDRTVMNVENSVLAAGNSAMDILERAPGVTIDKDDNISLKGKQGVTVMINDKLTYLSSAQLATLLRSTDGNTIQSIEIITNPSAKYDAAGNSGIINIKLKKNKQSGTNGSITVGGGYGHFGKDNSTLTLNHKQGALNLFGSFSHNDNKRFQDIGIMRIIDEGNAPATYFNQYTTLVQQNNNNSYRLGADYDLSAKNTIGFLMSGYFNGENDNNNNQTLIGPNFVQVDSSLNTSATAHQTFNNIAFNLNDTYKLDTAGQQITADVDYSKFRNNSQNIYRTDFFLSDGAMQHPQAFLGNLTPSVIEIRSAKVDYTYPITKSVKFESGLKYSDVKTDNNLTQKLAETDNYQSVNHFIYDEKINAAYINLNKSFKNTSVQAGLRAEYTQSNANGDSVNVTQNIQRNYLDFFPSVFINHTFSSKHEINLSYSRRIDRPQYDNLNPFVYHLDPYTYSKGNPYLKPQYTNNFELNYTYNKTITLTLGYSRTTDVMTEIPGTDPATKQAFVSQQNLELQNSYSVNLYAPYTITKWWSGDVNANGFYLGFKSAGLEGGNLDQGRTACHIRSTQTLTFANSYKAEISGDYLSALTYGLFFVKPQYSTDAGISHSFANKKANLKISMSDIFNTRRNDVTSNYQSNDMDIRQKRETRITRVTFTYNFGNTKIKARQHRSGDEDEKGRVKSGS